MLNDSVVLTNVFRQKDMDFVDLLNEFRCGIVSEKSVKLLTSARVGSLLRDPASVIVPTILYAKYVD